VQSSGEKERKLRLRAGLPAVISQRVECPPSRRHAHVGLRSASWDVRAASHPSSLSSVLLQKRSDAARAAGVGHVERRYTRARDNVRVGAVLEEPSDELVTLERSDGTAAPRWDCWSRASRPAQDARR
jgi:hypothetical protein